MSPKKGTTDDVRPTKLTVDMGKLIKRAREEAGLSQAELAQNISRRQASLSDIENGRMEVSAGTLMKLAITLQKPVTYFIPAWMLKALQPQDITPEEEELLIQAKRLTREQLLMIVTQVRALAEVDQRKYMDWLQEAEAASVTSRPRAAKRK